MKATNNEHGPKSTLVFYQLGPETILDVEKTLSKNRSLWIVDDQERPVNLPGVASPLKTIAFKNDDTGFDPDLDNDEPNFSDFGECPIL